MLLVRTDSTVNQHFLAPKIGQNLPIFGTNLVISSCECEGYPPQCHLRRKQCLIEGIRPHFLKGGIRGYPQIPMDFWLFHLRPFAATLHCLGTRLRCQSIYLCCGDAIVEAFPNAGSWNDGPISVDDFPPNFSCWNLFLQLSIDTLWKQGSPNYIKVTVASCEGFPMTHPWFVLRFLQPPSVANFALPRMAKMTENSPLVNSDGTLKSFFWSFFI